MNAVTARPGSPLVRGIFATLLGPTFDQLPPAVRAVHCGRSVWLEGTASVTRGRARTARLLCELMSLPLEQRDRPVTVVLEATSSGEIWSRWYGASRVMRSYVRAGGSLLVERLGPIALHFRLAVRRGALEWILARATLFGIPLPGRVFRGMTARAFEKDGRYAFAVSVALPYVGPVIAYEGSVDAAT